MLRRDEIPEHLHHQIPPFIELLATDIENNDPFALANLALCYAQGFQMPINWKEASQKMSDMDEVPPELVAWWHGMANKNEAEGHVILGWLQEIHGIADPDGKTTTQRFQAAREAGLDIPEFVS